MKIAHCVIATVALGLAWFESPVCGAPPTAAAALADAGSVDSQLTGTWEYEGGDGGARQKITLILREDGSYAKTLDATVQGAHYGGTHSGTWTANGMTVRLSGDGNWPPYSHDLSKFRKLR